MKRNSSVEQIRGPKAIEISKQITKKRIKEHVKYDEMIPGSPDEERSPKSKNFVSQFISVT